MNIDFSSSFERSLKSLPQPDQTEIKSIIADLIDVLSDQKQLQQGLGLKRLRNNYWEVRQGLKTRILFRWDGSSVLLVLVGNHDDVKRFLKQI